MRADGCIVRNTRSWFIGPGMVRRWVSLLGLVIAIAILGVNIVGLALPLRSRLVVADLSDFSGNHVLNGKDAVRQLDALDASDPLALASQATHIVAESIYHIDGDHLWPLESRSFDDYHYTVPITENWVLYALRYLHPSTYRYYHFCNWRHAVLRGIGGCGQEAMALTDYLRSRGIHTGIVGLSNHTVVTAEPEKGDWIVLDPDFGVVMPHDLSALLRNRARLESYYAGRLDREAWNTYTRRTPTIVYGAAETMYPRACALERWTYVAKWLLPLILGTLAALGWRGGRAIR